MGRYESQGSKAKLQERVTQFLEDKEHKFHEGATRLQMKISFEAHDFYAADVFYDNSYYIKFSIKKILKVNKNEHKEFLLSLKKRETFKMI